MRCFRAECSGSDARLILQQHPPQLLGGHTQRLILPLEQVDAAGRDRLGQGEGIDPGELRRSQEHLPGNKADAQVAANHREHLIDGLHLYIRTEGQIAPAEEVGIEGMGGCAGCKADDGVIRKLGQRQGLSRQLGKAGSADWHLLHLGDFLLYQGIRHDRSFGYHGEVGQAVLHSGQPLRC